MGRITFEHKGLNDWVAEMAAMCRPDDIVLIDGSQEQKKALEAGEVPPDPDDIQINAPDKHRVGAENGLDV